MDAADDRELPESDYLRFLRGLRPADDANDLSAAQAAELDFRTSFPGADALPDLDADLQHAAAQESADFARMLLAHDEHEQDVKPDVGERSEQSNGREGAHEKDEGEDEEDEEDEARARAFMEASEADAAAAVAAASAVVLHLSNAIDADDGVDQGGENVELDEEGEYPVDSKDRCRYYGKNRVRCPRAATGFDGRCAIHKHSQFCKHPRCSKFNQGNGYCIKHGGGKKCKQEGCEKQVQGYGYCSGHGGKPLCPVEGCDNKRMEGGFCKSHGGGRFCQVNDCKKRDIGGGFCIAHGGGKKCKAKDCAKVDRGGGFCKRHGGGKKCEVDRCKNWAIGGGICAEHKGPGKRCKTLGCTKYDLGGGHCIAHGGGRKCVVEGCDKIRQVNKLCRGHGGKLMCSIDGCDRTAQNFKLCKTHGGGKRCGHEGCGNMQKGGGFCIRHGGGTKCRAEGCNAVDRGGGLCKAHGGGKKCSDAYCNKWVVGGGFCSDHLELELSQQQAEDISRLATNYSNPQRNSKAMQRRRLQAGDGRGAGPASDRQLLRQRAPRLGGSADARAHSEQPKPSPQFFPNGQFHMLSSSPVALTASLSPLYRPPHLHQQQQQQHQHQHPHFLHGSTLEAASTVAAEQAAVDEEVGQLFTMHMPVFFDALEKFQYHQALVGLDPEGRDVEWAGWNAFSLMLKLGASCESTYHSMKYLEPDQLPSDTIEKMYGKLVLLMNHLADELRPVVDRQSRHLPAVAKPLAATGAASSDAASQSDEDGLSEEFESDSDPMLLMDLAMCGDMSYYVELLEQSAEFFSLRVPMLQLYRGLARSSVPRDYRSMLKLLETLLLRFDSFDHPLLETMRQSAIEELSTVHAAIQCDVHVGQYDFTRAMVALHKLKVQMRSWSDHIDAVSDYPMFDDTGVEEALLHPDEDEAFAANDASMSESIYSSASYSNQSTSSLLLRGQLSFMSSSVAGGESFSRAMPPGLSSSMLSTSGVLQPSSRYANVGDTAYDAPDETALLEKQPSHLSVEGGVMSPESDAPSRTLTRLFSQSNLLKRSGLLTVALPIPFQAKGLLQKPGDPYMSSGGTNSALSNTLEQAILGGSTAGGTAASVGHSGGGGEQREGLSGDANTLAAEMIALSVKKQERDDGFALPVYQWSRRFFRSLLAKFSLYFHQWLDPFERTGADYLSLDLTRFVRTPLGISYLQLMDVLVARAAQKGGDGAKTRVLLLLETQQLEDKGAHYYKHGYLCPSSSKTRSIQSELAEASAGRGKTSGPRAPGNSTADADANQQHELFMPVNKEQPEEASDFSELWGLGSWPAVFCYPDQSPPLEHWPNIVSLIMDNRAAIDSYRPAFTHSERRSKSTYFIARVDAAMYLVLLVEGTRRPSEKIAQDFMQSVAENLQHSGVFKPRVALSPASTGGQ